ncbi:hypothetical protein CPS_1606 [Colwellia psychrerythraea 34H]|uniref:Uncharacterized protein n=1 Tax=Colwellia psychrerythraea (strain 34H / ATCC BAA-681) TaxID=167879 RepID=Q485B7_COLP3|nr:hypothetical protein CPS_1606 [Colwellia psychrerythraea 34H]
MSNDLFSQTGLRLFRKAVTYSHLSSGLNNSIKPRSALTT